jgi:hypothetical protein
MVQCKVGSPGEERRGGEGRGGEGRGGERRREEGSGGEGRERKGREVILQLYYLRSIPHTPCMFEILNLKLLNASEGGSDAVFRILKLYQV